MDAFLAVTDLGVLSVAPLIPLLPLVATGLVGLISRVRAADAARSASHWPMILGVGGALVCSLVLSSEVARLDPGQYADTYSFYSWIAITANVSIDINFRVDPLTAIMLTVVCAVSLLVVIYARDYLREDSPGGGPGRPEPGYERFFALVGLFVFSMGTLVLAGNFLLLYLGAEAVGLCSYLLIGLNYPRPAAAAAAKRAFVVNRIGDVGLVLGILLIYLWTSPHVQAGESPLDYQVVFKYVAAGAVNQRQCTIIALLLLWAVVAKSAQLPLFVWLPDAMQAPSPASALMCAATTVPAGVYMVLRCGPIFAASPTAMAVVASVGAATALFAATIALAQYDLKRILAYATMSQVGYALLGAGVFAADAAMFHVCTHAVFMALLFLAAGRVARAMGGITDVRQFGGLRRLLPVTLAAFVVGALALAGFPPLSGFFSQGEIIRAAFRHHAVWGLIGLLTMPLTAFYALRMVLLAFAGPQRFPQGVRPRESGKWMLVALVLLAVGAAGGGYVGGSGQGGDGAGLMEPPGRFHEFLAPVAAPFAEAEANLHARTAGPVGEADNMDHTLAYISAALAAVGAALAYLLYVKRPGWADAVREAAPRAHHMLHNDYYTEEMNEALVVRPLRRTAWLLSDVDRLVVDGLVRLVARVPQLISLGLVRLRIGGMGRYGITVAGGFVLVVLVIWLRG